MLWLAVTLAQTAPAPISDVTGWSAIATSVVSTGFAVWYAWYMTTNRIPAIEDAHAKQVAAAEERHATHVRQSEERQSAHIELLISNFRLDIKAMWDIKREDDKRLSESLDKLSEILRANGCKFTQGH